MAGRVGYVPFAPTSTYDYGPGSRISELILRAGEAAARAQEQQGRIWGGAVADIGQQASAAIQDYQAKKAVENKERKERERKAALGRFATATTGDSSRFDEEIRKLPQELQPEAISFFQTQEKAKAEVAKAKAEMEAKESFRLADAAHRLKQAIGTPYEPIARDLVKRYYAEDYPEQAEKITQLPAEQLVPVLDTMIGGSTEFQEKLAKIERERAETEAKRAEPGLKERDFQERQRATNLQAETTRRGQDLQAAASAATLRETARGHDLTAAAAAAGQKPLTAEASQRLGYSVTGAKLAEELVKEFKDKEGEERGSGVERYRAAYKASLGVGGDTNLDRKVEDLIDTSVRARTGAAANAEEMKARKGQIYRYLDAYRGDTKGAIEGIERIAAEMTAMQESLDPSGAYRKRAAGANIARQYDSTDPDAGDPL